MEENNSLYTTTPLESAQPTQSSASEENVKSSVASDVASASSNSTTSSEASAESSAATQDEYLASLQDQSLKERTEVDDVRPKVRNVTVTEKDGTVVKVQLQAPSYSEAEDIDSKRTAVSDQDGGVVIVTTVRFQKALFSIVKQLLINNKPAGKFGFKLADDGHVEAFRAVVDEADSFLAAFLNPDSE